MSEEKWNEMKWKERMNEWNEWMNEWMIGMIGMNEMNEWMNGWMNE